MASWNWPRLINKIVQDVPFLQTALIALLKQDPTGIEDVPTGAKRLVEVSSGNWQLQQYNGSSWVQLGKLQMDVDTVDSKHINTGTAADTIPVRNASGQLPGDITGNAATASSAATLSATAGVGIGGTGATTAAAARTNLGVPPINHAASANTYGLGTDANYGHVKLSDAVNSTSGQGAGVAATPNAVKSVGDASVKLTGNQTINGIKTFEKINIKGSYPELTLCATVGYGNIVFRDPNYVVYSTDGNGDPVAMIKPIYWENNTTYPGELHIQGLSGDTVTAEIALYSGINGNESYATAPTITNYRDSSNKIATTAWVTNATRPTISTAAPSGGADGDIWYQYIA